MNSPTDPRAERVGDMLTGLVAGFALAGLYWMLSTWDDTARAWDEGAYFARLEDHLARTGWQDKPTPTPAGYSND